MCLLLREKCLVTWAVECWIMHGKATTVHSLHMDRLEVANRILSWAMMLTKVKLLPAPACHF